MKTKEDPTGLAKSRKRTAGKLTARLNRARRKILRLFRDIPKERRLRTPLVNQEVFYDYDLTPEELEELSRQIDFILNQELLESQDLMLEDWWYKPVIEQPYRKGTIEETSTFNTLLAQAAAAGVAISLIPQKPDLPPFAAPSAPLPTGKIDPQQVLISQGYSQAVSKVQTSNYRTIKGLSQDASKQVFGVIDRGIDAKLTPRRIAEQINERFDVSKSSAKRIAETEVNKAYNDAKTGFAEQANQQFGIRTGVLHISALSPTTRANHAARHGNVYTVEDQNAWWDQGSNRINCKCSVRSVLIDGKGKVVDAELQKEIKADRVFPIDEPKTPKPIQKPKTTKQSIDQVQKAKHVEPIVKVEKSKKAIVVEDQKIVPGDKPPKLSRVSLTGDESAYVEYYKGDGFYKSNEILRNPDAFSSSEVESAGKMRDSINSAIAKSEILESGTLYRGIRSKEIFDNAEKLIGKSIPISTPQSTASNAGSSLSWAGLLRDKQGNFFSSDKGASVVFKIRAKKGQRALDLESLSMGNTGEKEVLLPSGGNYKVLGVKDLKSAKGDVTGKVIEVDLDG